MNRGRAKTLLTEIFDAALAAVAPGPALLRALEPRPESTTRVWVIALGKAAHAMGAAAVRALEETGRSPAGGLIVAADEGPGPHPSVPVVVGDHPEPGDRSLAAAAALERVVHQVQPTDTVWVLLSGGTTSLVASPQTGIAPADLTTLYGQLLRSGLDIRAMNLVRKRFTRWSAGRLAQSLAHARGLQCYIVSDVIGDDLAAIGSGPCSPDAATAKDVRHALDRAGLRETLPASFSRYLDDVERGDVRETPKPGDAVFDRVDTHLIATNRMALEAAGRRAVELGAVPKIVELPIVGEAAAAGTTIAETLLARQRDNAGSPTCLILGGETTVTIRDRNAGSGGRSQELALAAARVLRGASRTVALLAAGTDGRDGPTDAAGAIVDEATWDRIAAAGRDPQGDLQRHDSYAALAAADALIKTGPTGTNVMDVVLGIT